MNLDAIFYPGLLMCGFMILALLAIFGSILYWMRHADAQYRKCPECGQLGAGYIVNSELVDSQSHIDHKSWRRKKIIVENIEDQYECEHCKHNWTVDFQRASRTALKTPKSEN